MSGEANGRVVAGANRPKRPKIIQPLRRTSDSWLVSILDARAALPDSLHAIADALATQAYVQMRTEAAAAAVPPAPEREAQIEHALAVVRAWHEASGDVRHGGGHDAAELILDAIVSVLPFAKIEALLRFALLLADDSTVRDLASSADSENELLVEFRAEEARGHV